MDYDFFSDYPRIASALMNEPWLIEPGFHRVLVEQLAAHERTPVMARPSQKARDPEPEKFSGRLNRFASYDEESGLGVLELKGPIGKGLSQMAMDCGAGVCLDVASQGLDLLAARKPRAVQLYLNTPGGTVGGVEEFAGELRAFSAQVAPVHGYVDGMCCSAGEWIASGAVTRHASPSATLGSIGVYCALFDQTAKYAQQGIKVHLVKTGPLKGMGFPGTEVTAAQLADLQAEVDAIAADFFGAMAGRWAGVDPAVHFTGGTFMAKSAAGMKLHDGLVESRKAHLVGMMRMYGGA